MSILIPVLVPQTLKDYTRPLFRWLLRHKKTKHLSWIPVYPSSFELKGKHTKPWTTWQPITSHNITSSRERTHGPCQYKFHHTSAEPAKRKTSKLWNTREISCVQISKKRRSWGRRNSMWFAGCYQQDPYSIFSVRRCIEWMLIRKHACLNCVLLIYFFRFVSSKSFKWYNDTNKIYQTYHVSSFTHV